MSAKPACVCLVSEVTAQYTLHPLKQPELKGAVTVTVLRIYRSRGGDPIISEDSDRGPRRSRPAQQTHCRGGSCRPPDPDWRSQTMIKHPSTGLRGGPRRLALVQLSSTCYNGLAGFQLGGVECC